MVSAWTGKGDVRPMTSSAATKSGETPRSEKVDICRPRNGSGCGPPTDGRGARTGGTTPLRRRRTAERPPPAVVTLPVHPPNHVIRPSTCGGREVGARSGGEVGLDGRHDLVGLGLDRRPEAG